MKNILFLLIVFLLIGCKEEFFINLPDQAPKLVVEGIVTNGSLSKNQPQSWA